VEACPHMVTWSKAYTISQSSQEEALKKMSVSGLSRCPIQSVKKDVASYCESIIPQRKVVDVNLISRKIYTCTPLYGPVAVAGYFFRGG